MNEQQKARLSAYLDGELSVADLNKVTDQLADDENLKEQLNRYQQFGDLIRENNHPQIDASSISAAVSQQLADEPTILAPRTKRTINVPRIALGAALAATVAMVTINVAPQLLSTDDEFQTPETFAFAPKLSTPNFSIKTVALQSEAFSESAAQPSEQRWKMLKPRVQHQLDRYLVEHNEYASRTGVAGPNAHIGFVSIKNAR